MVPSKHIYKEIFAAVLLTALFLGTLANTRYIGRVVEELRSHVERSENLAREGNFEMASDSLREGIDKWESYSPYTRILLRHTEIDSTTDAFYDLLSELEDGALSRAIGAFGKLDAHLRGIAEIEHVSLGSIF